VDNITFGWVMTVLGIGVTTLTLLLLTLVINILIKLFPYKEEPKKE
jgi:Na+-transporting methylmalonyl-CoA/oxaloacetate decarboxylase gamma subunit